MILKKLWKSKQVLAIFKSIEAFLSDNLEMNKFLINEKKFKNSTIKSLINSK